MLRLGIDFGTCYSSAALLLEGIPTPINAPLTPGYSLPSSVFITEQGEVLVGQVAENNRQKNPQRYRREFKRDLGSTDPYTLGNICMLPEELVTEILKKLKSEAEKVAQGRGEKSLTDVLITVPATYSSYKRSLMQEAGEKAGFSQIKLLEEPVAAAIYYSRHGQINDGDIILVYDLGGGTFDATLMQKQGDKYQVLGMPKGLAYCGGTDFDHLIYQQLKTFCSAKLREQLEPKNAWLARAIVGDLCRDLKHQLSEQSTASIYIPMGLGNVEPFELTREAFNEMISPLIDETLDCCDQLVRTAGKNWQQVNRLLLVGGSSRIPYVKEAIEKRLKISPFLVDKPELAVCLGAAINDSISSPKSSENELRERKAIQQAFEERKAKEREAENERKRKEEILRRREGQRQETERQQREREKLEAELQRREQQEKREAEIKAKEKLNSHLSDEAKLYFKKLIPYLESQGFECHQNVICGNYTLDYLAVLKQSITYNHTQYFWVSATDYQTKVIIPLFYVGSPIEFEQLQNYSNDSLNYVKIPPPNAIYSAIPPRFMENELFLLCPIIVVDEIDSSLAVRISQEKPFIDKREWECQIFSGVYVLKDKRVFFPLGSDASFWGWGKFFDHWREFISSILTP